MLYINNNNNFYSEKQIYIFVSIWTIEIIFEKEKRLSEVWPTEIGAGTLRLELRTSLGIHVQNDEHGDGDQSGNDDRCEFLLRFFIQFPQFISLLFCISGSGFLLAHVELYSAMEDGKFTMVYLFKVIWI